MIKKFFSNMNTAQKVFVFIPMVLIVSWFNASITTLFLDFQRCELGTFIYYFGRGLNIGGDVSASSFYSDYFAFHLIVACIIGFFLFKTKNKNQT